MAASLDGMKTVGLTLTSDRPKKRGKDSRLARHEPEKAGARRHQTPQLLLPFDLHVLRREQSFFPAEKVMSLGPQALSTEELIAVVLGERDLSELTALAGRVRDLAQMTVRELSRLPGIGKRKAARLLSAMELGRRWAVERKQPMRKFRCGWDLFERYHLLLRDRKKEHFVCALFDRRNRFIRDEVVSIGGLTSSHVRLGEAFRGAVRESAAAVAFVHNHPSGDPRPSEEDRLLTLGLSRAARLLQIRLLDHVIIGEKSFHSFFEEGVL